MAFYVLKPGTHIQAAPYTAGMEDGTTTWTSDSVVSDPIPAALESVVGYWVSPTPANEWTATVPYVGAVQYLFPDDYVITPTSGPKQRMSKTEFEAKYQLEDSGS